MKIFVVLLSLLLLPGFAGAVTFSLKQCVDYGVETNPQVKSYRIAVDEAQEGLYEAWGAFLPTLSADYGHSRLLNNGSAGFDTDYLSQKSDSFSVRLSQPLFTGMAGIAGLRKARSSHEYRETEYHYMVQQLSLKISLSFYDLLKAEALVSKWTDSVGRLQRQKKIAQAWIDQDLAPRLRLLEVENEYANAQQQLASSKAALAIAQANLREWLALSGEDSLFIEGDLQQTKPVNCATSEACLDKALEQRPELKLARLNISMAREDAKSILARNLPRVSLDAGWTDYKRDYDSHLVTDIDRDYYTLSLNLSMRPFQGGRNIFAYRKQKLEILRLEHERTRQVNAVEAEVKTRFQQFLEAKSRIVAAIARMDASREAYQFADKAAKLGVNSLDDLLNAEIRLTQAEINKINADHALQQAIAQVNYAVGSQILTE